MVWTKHADEATDYIGFLRRIREAQRKVLGIDYVYYFYNEDTTQHFHTWMVPRYDWMNVFGRSVESVRPVLLHARNEMATEGNLQNVRMAVDSLREALGGSAESDRPLKFIRLEPSDLSEDTKVILGAALFEATPEDIETLLDTVYSAPDTRLFGLSNEGKVVAIAGIRGVKGSTAEFLHIAVDDSARKQGFGTELIRSIVGAEGLTEMLAETDRDAVGFYKRCGFSIESLGEKYPGVERFACRLSQGGMKDHE